MKTKRFRSPSANVPENAIVCPGTSIDQDVDMGENVYVGHGTRFRRGSSIGSGSYFVENVLVGPRVRIGEGVLALSGAKICPNDVRSVSSNGRTIGNRAIIGAEVLIHDEGELGEDAIVPTQDTIASFGNFGSKNRVITIYGSDFGPLYSIGCQIGVSYDTVRRRVIECKETSPASAGTYFPYLGVFSDIGRIVQREYDRERQLIEELLDMQAGLVQSQFLFDSTL